MVRTTLLLSLLLVAGCHARFKKAAPGIGNVRIEVVNLGGPSVSLPSSGSDSVVGAVLDVTQAVRAGNIARHIQDKVDPNQVNQAFADGFADGIGSGPPFGYAADAPDLLQYELTGWGMGMTSFTSPGVYFYQLRVRGYHADGKKFYKSGVTCATNAGTTGWLELSPFGPDSNPEKIKNLPPEKVQAIFDATAKDCATQALLLLRKHAG